MKAIYKSLSSKYSDEDIERKSGSVHFVGYMRLKHTSLSESSRLKDNEDIIGLKIDDNGLTCYIETNNHTK